MINRLILPLETKARIKWATPFAGKAQLFRLVVLVLSLLTGLLSQAQLPVANFSASKVSGCQPLVVTFQDQSSGNPIFWNWDLGNGQLSNLQNPTAVYSQPGTYSVTLVVRNANGTNGITKTNYITVYPAPLIAYSSDKAIACVPASVQFTDQSTDPFGTINKWKWDFGDGTTSTLQNPSHTYTATGFYTVALTITSSTGCSSEAARFRMIRVVSGVTPDFAPKFDSVCKAPFGVQFINQTSGPGMITYNWDLGNGVTSTAESPSTVYNSSGTFNVKLTATSEFGCIGTITKPVSSAGGVTSFNAPDSACVNKPVNFTNTASPPALSANWTFGDGTSSNQLNPTKTYNSPGLYTVIMRNQYAACKDSTSKSITIIPPPTVDFTSDVRNACKGPFTVNFQDVSPNAVAWQWNFGDGGTSTQKNPSHTYASNGTYDVTLTITSSFGCSNTIKKSQFIKILKPILGIVNVPAGGCIPYTFTPVPNVTAIDGVASYAWDYGDGGGVETSSSHTYKDSGTYVLKMIVTTNGGCTQSLTVTDAVRTGPVPFVDFVTDTNNACASGVIKFKSLSFPADHWTWDFNDGTVVESPVDSIFHSFADTGYFNVKLTAVNNGCPNSVTKNQVVHINPPIAKFMDTVLDCTQKTTVTFTNSSKVDASYGAITYVWDFGDGSPTSGVPNPVHTYPALGKYTATLTVTNGTCASSLSREIELVAEKADFSVSKQNPCRGEPIILSAISSNPDNIRNYQWTITGTPTFDGDRAVQTLFGTNGSYSVQLTITDNNGCTDTKSVPNYITVTGPTTDFLAIDTGGCKNSTIRFSDLSVPAGTITKWKWNFGDGQSQTFTTVPFTHKYTDTGYYQVQLIITDSQGCTDSLTKANVVRITSPKADFYAPKNLFCAGGVMQFKDSSSGLITGYNWAFGDGGSSTIKDPTHTYLGPDSMYSVRLVVTDTVGCQDSLTKVNYVQIRSAKPGFDAVDTSSICPPLETKFSLRSLDYESFFWDFGDGQQSLLQNPKHFYNAYGTYEAKLYVVGYGGCLDSISKQINVYNPYTAPFSYTPLDACNELNVDFSIGPPPDTKWNLYFGDNEVDSSQRTSLSHLYKTPSFYSPYLLVTDHLDCQATLGGPDVVKVYGAEPFFGLNKKAFCDSGTVLFNNYTITNDTIVSSVWDFGDGITSTIKDPSHFYGTPGTYYASLTATTTRGCTKTLYDTIRVPGTPEPIITGPDIACLYATIPFDGSLVVPDTAIKWSWNLGNGQTASQQNVTTVYNSLGKPTITLVAANFLGCKDTVTKGIQVMPLPQISILSEPTVLSGTGIVIPVTYSPNVVSYLWSPTSSLSCADCPNPFAKPQFTTKYRVSAIDSNGCTNSRDITVTVVCNEKNYFIPNTFSPNGDGSNDVFYPRGSGINRIHSMRIFNRWGELVFERKDFLANESAAGWNGTVKGKPAEQDVYVYVIEFICDNATIIPYRGNVALIR